MYTFPDRALRTAGVRPAAFATAVEVRAVLAAPHILPPQPLWARRVVVVEELVRLAGDRRALPQLPRPPDTEPAHHRAHALAGRDAAFVGVRRSEGAEVGRLRRS
eukprot:gene4516-biopygen7448